jgi:hypothetical protein
MPFTVKLKRELSPRFTILDMAKSFLPDDVNQSLLFPPSLHDWLPERHLARLLVDVVSALDLSAIYVSYDEKDSIFQKIMMNINFAQASSSDDQSADVLCVRARPGHPLGRVPKIVNKRLGFTGCGKTQSSASCAKLCERARLQLSSLHTSFTVCLHTSFTVGGSL